jgi:hypothetical protein
MKFISPLLITKRKEKKKGHFLVPVLIDFKVSGTGGRKEEKNVKKRVSILL